MAQNVIKLTRKNSPEQNRKVIESAMRKTENVKALRESIRREFDGLDIFDKENFPVHNPNFSISEMKKTVEAATSSGFPQLLRAGVQMAFNNMVETYTGTTYEQIAHVVASSMDTELYAPLDGISFLSERGSQQAFSESQIAGLDLKLKNREFGQILSIDQNLLDDDQTGQMQSLVGDLAEWTNLLYEVYTQGKLASVANMSYAGLSIPQSETKPSYEANYPFTTSASPFRGGGFNRPTSFAALDKSPIEAGIIAMMNQKNLLGLKMSVSSDNLICSPAKQFDAMVLLQSTLNPSTTPAGANTVGGAYSINPIKSILNTIVSRYVFDQNGSANAASNAWYIADGKKPWFVLQLRDPGSVVMENPESGESFTRKVVRHRLDIRMNADYINPRFVWQGSNGSA